MKSYTVGYVVVHPVCSAATLRTWLTKKLPRSAGLVVTQGEDNVRVIVETDRPDLALRAGLDCGPLEDLVINREKLVSHETAAVS